MVLFQNDSTSSNSVDSYELIFILTLIVIVLLSFVLIFSLQRLRQKSEKRLLIILSLYFLFAIISNLVYAATALITWSYPWKVSYMIQCVLYDWVFYSSIIGDILLGEFINEIFYRRNKKITFYLIIGG